MEMEFIFEENWQMLWGFADLDCPTKSFGLSFPNDCEQRFVPKSKNVQMLR